MDLAAGGMWAWLAGETFPGGGGEDAGGGAGCGVRWPRSARRRSTPSAPVTDSSRTSATARASSWSCTIRRSNSRPAVVT
ncbi:hypothetical protein [Streptomyces sp. H27-D2]|uniref:hypothetical protein n=1 Tax=Streptomyces sp. H27-D2 TaxID=3046304 RepID=UPI002DB5AC46|nr:hypothetical protein [Streptomyces sp. H27-D2]MEC4018204.1 hypothetical protein [Streptomyces sp. H27-D2]